MSEHVGPADADSLSRGANGAGERNTAKVCDFAMHETTGIGPIHHVLSAIYPFPGNPDEGSRKLPLICVRVSFVCVFIVCEDMPAAVVRFRSLPDDEWLCLGIRPPPPRLGREQQRKVVRHAKMILGYEGGCATRHPEPCT